MKVGWKAAQIGEVCTVIAGQSPKGSAYNDQGVGLPFYQGKKEFRDRHIGPPTTWTSVVTKEGEPGDILMSVRAPVGPINEATQRICIGRGLAAIRAKGGLDRDFLWYALLWLQPKIKGSAGAVFDSINKAGIESLPIPLPPLEEQQRIVASLDEAFAGLARTHAHTEANLQNARELFESALGALFERDETTSLQTVGALVDAGVLEKPLDGNHGETHPKKADFVKSGVPFVMASDLKDGQVDQIGCHHIAREQADSLRKGFAKDGDVLLSHKGTIGRTAILETDLDYVMLTPQVTYYRSTDQDKLSTEYLYFAFQSGPFQKQINEEAGGGATRAYIGITKQLDLELPIPAIENQISLSKDARKIEACAKKALADYEAKLEDLDDLRQSLLQKAFAGELT